MSKTEFNIFEYYDMLLAGQKVPLLSPTCSFSVHENDIQIDLSEAQYRDNIKKKATFIEIVSQRTATSRNKTLIEVLVIEQKKERKVSQLSITEIGCLMASYELNSDKLDLTSNVLYLGALMLFDLYDLNLIDLYFRLDDQNISIKDTNQECFKHLEKVSSEELALSLALIPRAKKVPNTLPDCQKAVFTEVLRMTSFLNDYPVSMLVHDFLVACKCQMFMNMQLMECRAWAILELVEKKILTYERKYLVFFNYFLTDDGKEWCIYLAERLNELSSGQYAKKKSPFEGFSEANERNLFIVQQLLIHLGHKQIKKAAKVTADQCDKAIQRQEMMGNQCGALLRQPNLKLQPENQESWLVVMSVAIGLCLEEAFSSVAGQF